MDIIWYLFSSGRRRHILIFESRMVKDKYMFRGIKMLQNEEHKLISELNKYITSNEFNTGRFYYAENKDSSYDLKNDYPSGYSHGSIRFKYYDLNEGFTEEDMLEDLKKF